jgi:hypothetical protein
MDRLVRRAEITEIVGRLSSGRTSLFVACLAEVTAAGGMAALVDADGAFDPASAARGGVVLERLLWVRGDGRRDAALRATDVLVRCPGFTLVALDFGELPPRLPLTAAFRLKLAVRRSDVALVLVGCRRIAGAGASLAVATEGDGVEWGGPAGRPTRLARLHTRLSVARGRGAPCVPEERSWCA